MFIIFSQRRDKAWFHVSVAVVLCAAKITKLLENFLTILNQPQQHWKIEMILWGFAEELNKLWIMRGESGSSMDSRTMMRGESGDDFDSVKP